MVNVLEKATAALNTLVRLLAMISGVLLLGLMALTVVAVVMRKVFNAPIMGVQDVSEASLVVVVFLALAYCGWTGGHISINLIESVFKGRALVLLNAGMRFFCAAFLAGVAWFTAVMGLESMAMGDASNLIQIPRYPFYLIAALGSGLYALVLLVMALRAVRGLPDVKGP